ncbi:TetR family transcriptional regulator [Tumebacillus sp. BK434]|uniref:TetR/AcrR family transcriptional regulator n=1 Tax=Tumebacillus sp. BK434 TaxID=2512169 RepID=UPI0010527334|nr:TetR/AcrR family transcriptional regulator [Tumebacillus sp. BK434]TCP58016.1 TetR family transcriptional regulator [Tumebacillus sp. BK434]
MEIVDKRRAILEAAAKRFSTSGFHETKVGEIAEDAGIAKGTVYLHFKDKESLLAEVVHYQMREYQRIVEEEIAPYESAADKLRAYARFQVAKFPQMVKFHKLNFEHMLKFKNKQEFEQEHHQQLRQLMSLLTGVIRYGIERGEFREMDTTDASLVITGAIHTYMQAVLTGMIEEKDQAGAEALVDMAIRGLAR